MTPFPALASINAEESDLPPAANQGLAKPERVPHVGRSSSNGVCSSAVKKSDAASAVCGSD